jgi:hypothetical protein
MIDRPDPHERPTWNIEGKRMRMRVAVGPQAGVFGHIFLRDMEISPAVDSIRVGEVPDFDKNKLLRLSELFWKNDEKVIGLKAYLSVMLF